MGAAIDEETTDGLPKMQEPLLEPPAPRKVKRRRTFTPLERAVLYHAATGCCTACGIALPDTWEADHIAPYAHGGHTDITNGQALCRTCNRRKGDHVTAPRAPRDWHIRALRDCELRKWPADYLVVATPGAGKTDFACQWVTQLLERRAIVRAVIVCPTAYLCDQWRETASRHYGLEFEVYDNRETPEAPDHVGMICTYQQINKAWALFHRKFCGRPTGVVCDEIHHVTADDKRAWGEGLQYAFEPAVKRLALSGTAWRSDNNRISFLSYDDNGRSRADFTYSYAEAIRDGICRAVFFPSFDGRMEWWSIKQGNASATFSEAVSDIDASRRLKAALLPDGEWIPSLFQAADRQLQATREEDPTAGGLVIAMDQAHAISLASVLEQHTGERPALAVSDGDDPKGEINRFRTSTARWLVAVKMVSEGVDIPRLRVCVYATNTRTELAFRQAVGRVLRGNTTAHFFIPREDQLIAMAQTIADERNHELDLDINEDLKKESERQPSEDPDLFVPLSASQAKADTVVFQQDQYPQSELAEARQYMKEVGAVIDPVLVAKLARAIEARIMLRADLPHRSEASTERPIHGNTTTESLQERKERLGAACDKQANRLAYQTGLEHKQVQQLLIRATGRKKLDRSYEDLTWCLQLLRVWLGVKTPGRTWIEWLEVAGHARRSA